MPPAEVTSAFPGLDFPQCVSSITKGFPRGPRAALAPRCQSSSIEGHSCGAAAENHDGGVRLDAGSAAYVFRSMARGFVGFIYLIM